MIGRDPFINPPMAVNLLDTRLVESYIIFIGVSELKDIFAQWFGGRDGLGKRGH